MRDYLILYLTVTGIGAAIVLAMPWLVIMGLFALILPGLILGLLPTAFMYGALFALFWFPLHGLVGDGPAAAIAAVATFAILYAIPIKGNRVTSERYRTQLAGDTLPAGRIELRGHVLIESWSRYNREHSPPLDPVRPGEPQSDAYYAESRRCDDVCAALLFMDGVESVTVYDGSVPLDGAPPPSGAVTFVRVPRAEGVAGIAPKSGGGRFGQVSQGRFHDALKLRLATTDSIQGLPPRSAFDLRLVASEDTCPLPEHPRQRDPWMQRLGPRSVHSSRLEIFDAAGTLLLRKTAVSARRIAQPMHYMPTGSLENFHFEWAARPIAKGGHWAMDRLALLRERTDLDTDLGVAALDSAVEDELRALVADPAAPAPPSTLKLVPVFFDHLDPKSLTAAQARLAVALIADPRIREVGQVYKLGQAPAVGANALRQAIAGRWLAADANDSGLAHLGSALKTLPAGTFVTLTAAEEAVLGNMDRRMLAAALIARLADQGAEAAPRLAAILVEHVTARQALFDGPRYQGSHHSDVIAGAVNALVRIGPSGPEVLQQVEALGRFRIVQERRFGIPSDWDLLLARLGKPVEEIDKPGNMSGTTENYRRHLRGRVERVERTKEVS